MGEDPDDGEFPIFSKKLSNFMKILKFLIDHGPLMQSQKETKIFHRSFRKSYKREEFFYILLFCRGTSKKSTSKKYI